MLEPPGSAETKAGDNSLCNVGLKEWRACCEASLSKAVESQSALLCMAGSKRLKPLMMYVEHKNM